MTDIVDGAEFFAQERLKWREKEFQKAVLDLAKDHGWTHRYHTYFSDRSERGFPDLLMIRNGIMVIAELKTMKGRISPAQVSWLEALGRVSAASDNDGTGMGPEFLPVQVYTWRPCCWNSGEIERVITCKPRG